MVPVPVVALAALIAATVALAIFCERFRRDVSALRTERTALLQRAAAVRQQIHADGCVEGYKRGWGEAYTAAMKAERQGRNPIDAILRVGRINAPALNAPNPDTILEYE